MSNGDRKTNSRKRRTQSAKSQNPATDSGVGSEHSVRKRDRVEWFQGTPTTRMYPRTLQEAFPNAAENAEWWYPPKKQWTISEVLMLAIGICMWIGIAYYFAKD